jgi:hypothetical protein
VALSVQAKSLGLFISAMIFSVFAVLQLEIAKITNLAISISLPAGVLLAAVLLLFIRRLRSSPMEKTILKSLIVAEVVIVICYSAMAIGLV